MNDSISRQAVLDIIDDLRDRMTVEGYWSMVERVKALPSAQPNLQQTCNKLATDCISRQPEKRTEERTETHACDCISRQAVINTVRTIILGFFSDEDGAMTDTEKKLLRVNKSVCNGVRELPSAQQDCTECEEYDHERHYCPKFCDVIRKTADELQVEASCKLPERKTGRWIIKDNPGTGWYRITCSECGEDVTSTAPCIGFYPNAKVMWNYCPDCGTRMEGEG